MAMVDPSFRVSAMSFVVLVRACGYDHGGINDGLDKGSYR
jgi:hypothetical protein